MRAASISVAMSASFHWIACKSAIRFPNCRRSSAYDRALDDDVVRDQGVQSERILIPGHPDVIAVEDEGADTAGHRRLGIGPSEQEKGARVARVRDPLLRARDAPAAARRLGAGPERAGIGTSLGLGQRERSEVLAARERWDEA